MAPVSDAETSQAAANELDVQPAIGAADQPHPSPRPEHVERSGSGAPDEFDSAITVSSATGEQSANSPSVIEDIHSRVVAALAPQAALPAPGSEASVMPARGAQAAATHAPADAGARDAFVGETATRVSPEPIAPILSERRIVPRDLTGLDAAGDPDLMGSIASGDRDLSGLNTADAPTLGASGMPAATPVVPPSSIGPVIRRQVLRTESAMSPAAPVAASGGPGPSSGVPSGGVPAVPQPAPAHLASRPVPPPSAAATPRTDLGRPGLAAAPVLSGSAEPPPRAQVHAVVTPGPAAPVQPPAPVASLPPAAESAAAQPAPVSPVPAAPGPDVLPLVAGAQPPDAGQTLSGRSAAGASSAPPPRVRVTIGRIDVRVAPASSAAPVRRSGPTRPAPSLSDYLKGGTD